MTKAEQVMEKIAINAGPANRLAVRLRNMYGKFHSTKEHMQTAKKIHKILGDNRTDILQKSLAQDKGPLSRIGKVGPYSPWKGFNKK